MRLRCFRGDERGQSIQIGAVLLFGILVVLFSTYQAFVVPEQNRQVEFNHNQEAQTDLTDLRNAIVSAGDGTDRAVTLQLGTSYAGRVLFLNPPPPTGAVRTAGTTDPGVNLSVENASVSGDAGDFWTGETRTYTTGELVYRPSYNVYSEAPETVYSNTVLYNQFREDNLTVTGQALIDGERLTLVALNGSLNRARGDSVSVDVRAVSASTNRVAVTNASAGSNLTIALPTRLSADTWEDLLEEELVENGGHVRSVTETALPGEFDRVRIELEPDTTYSLTMVKVGVGTRVTEETAAYLASVQGNGTTVPEGESEQLVVEARDSYNNPLAGTVVEATADRGTLTSTTEETDAEGQAQFTYEAPDDVDGTGNADEVNFSISVDPETAASFDPETAANVTIDLTIGNSDDSGTGGGGGGGGSTGSQINPSSSEAVVLTSADIGNSDSSNVDITLENKDVNNVQSITEARFNFYSVDQQPGTGQGNQRSSPKSVDISNRTLKSGNNGGQFRPIDSIDVPAGGTKTFTVTFNQDADGSGDFEAEQGDFFILSVIFDNGRDATYFIAPED